MKLTIIAVLALALCSCVPAPTSYVKISELGINGGAIITGASATVDGCLVETVGDISGLKIDYMGDKCKVRSVVGKQ